MYPGDRRPKPVAFLDPATAAERRADRAPAAPDVDRTEAESGISAPHRIEDLADVLELIRAVDLPADYANRLNPYVREKYLARASVAW
jgi:hypothetical protein